MQNYKYIFDILSSTAALVAITTVLWSWFKNWQLPLKIERIVIHKQETDNTYILVIKNRKPYPVEIKSTECYTKPSYLVEQKNNQKPEFRSALSLSNQIFRSTASFVINANGHTDIRFKGSQVDDSQDKLLFSIGTSHGYHQIWGKDILSVEMSGKTEVFGMEFMYESDSLIKAKYKYFLQKIKNAKNQVTRC